MKITLARLAARLVFFELALYVALRITASHFDRTEITTLVLWPVFYAAFELGLAALPERFRGRFGFPDAASLGDALRFTRGAAIALFAAVCLAVAVDVRREIGSIRDAVSAGDIRTTWTEGSELRTIRTPQPNDTDTEEWVETHLASVRAARKERIK